MPAIRRNAPFFLLLIGIFWCGKTGARSYPEEGPFYDLPYVVNGSTVQLREMWMAAGSDQTTLKHNFVAPVTLRWSGSEKSEGSVEIGQPFRGVDDSWKAWSHVVPVRGTDRYVQIQNEMNRINIFVLGRSGDAKRQLASFPNEAENNEDGACAVSRSGHHVLVVSPKKITIWDVVDWREQAVIHEKELLEIRSVLMKDTGIPGKWWLTNDLRYVVVNTTGEHWKASGGRGPVYAEPEKAGGIEFDPRTGGVVVDQKTGEISTFVAEIPPPVPGTFYISDAENVKGRLWLLYTLNILDLRVAIANTEGHVRASHTVSSYTAQLAGWDPERDEVWIEARDSDNSLPSVHPEADHHLIVWNVGKNTERRFKVPVDQIRKAVENAK